MKFAIVVTCFVVMMLFVNLGLLNHEASQVFAWVCGEDAPSAEATCTPVPSATRTPSITPYVVTATFSPTPRATRTPKATQTPVIIIVTATPDVERIIKPPNTGSGGYR